MNDDKKPLTDVSEPVYDVFEDLGIKDSQHHLKKVELAYEFGEIVRDLGLTQNQVAKRLDTEQADVSKLMRGIVRGFSYDRIFDFLLGLKQDINITIKPHRPKKDLTGNLKIILPKAHNPMHQELR